MTETIPEEQERLCHGGTGGGKGMGKGKEYEIIGNSRKVTLSKFLTNASHCSLSVSSQPLSFSFILCLNCKVFLSGTICC